MSVPQLSLDSRPGLHSQVLTLVAEGGKLADTARSKGSGRGIDTFGILGVLSYLKVLPLQNKIKMVTTAKEAENHNPRNVWKVLAPAPHSWYSSATWVPLSLNHWQQLVQLSAVFPFLSTSLEDKCYFSLYPQDLKHHWFSVDMH